MDITVCYPHIVVQEQIEFERMCEQNKHICLSVKMYVPNPDNSKNKSFKIVHARLQNRLICEGYRQLPVPTTNKERLRGSAPQNGFLTEKLTVTETYITMK